MIVDSKHVNVAAKFLSELYDNLPMGYLQFSEEKSRYDTVDTAALDAAISDAADKRSIKRSHIVDLLLDYDHITRQHMTDLIGLDMVNAVVFMNQLYAARAVKMRYNHLVKTEAFIQYLRRRAKDGFADRI